MPSSDQQAFRRKLFPRSGDIPGAGGGMAVVGITDHPDRSNYHLGSRRPASTGRAIIGFSKAFRLDRS